jgi:hypothetical protein
MPSRTTLLHIVADKNRLGKHLAKKLGIDGALIVGPNAGASCRHGDCLPLLMVRKNHCGRDPSSSHSARSPISSGLIGLRISDLEYEPRSADRRGRFVQTGAVLQKARTGAVHDHELRSPRVTGEYFFVRAPGPPEQPPYRFSPMCAGNHDVSS